MMTLLIFQKMKKASNFILKKIKEKDNEQYEALLLSIGAEKC